MNLYEILTLIAGYITVIIALVALALTSISFRNERKDRKKAEAKAAREERKNISLNKKLLKTIKDFETNIKITLKKYSWKARIWILR